MSRPYYTLIIKEPGDANWTPQFGDYKRAVVAQEWLDTKKDWPKGTGCKIIKTGDGKVAVEKAIASLNREPIVTQEMRNGFAWKGSR